MRPVPRPQYLKAAIFFVAVAAAYAVFALSDYRLSDTQTYMAWASLKYHDPSLFTCDGLFGRGDLWQFHNPALQKLNDLLMAAGGYQDVYFPFRCLAGIATFLYLWGMFALLYRQTLSWSVSVFTSILSTAVIYSIGRSYWGVGSLASMTPWTLALVCVPPLVLMYLKRQDQWRRLRLVFFLAGLLANIHLVMAANLCLVLLVVYLGRNGFTRQAWSRAGIFAAMAIVGSLPTVIYYIHLRASVGFGGYAGAWAAYEAFRIGDLAVLYPDLLKSLFFWLLWVGGILTIPGLAMLTRGGRMHVRDIRTWGWFAAAAATIALVLHGLSQLLGIAFNTLPPTVDFVQAASLLMLPVYVLLGRAIVTISRVARGYRLLMAVAFVVLMTAWMLPSDNLRVARNAVLDTLTMYMPESEKPRVVQRHHENYNKFREVAAIGRYAQHNTQPCAVFVTDLPEFRMFGRRSVVTCPDDVKYVYYLRPGYLESWLALGRRQMTLLHPQDGRASGEALTAYVGTLRTQEPFGQADGWFVILDSDEAPSSAAPLEEIRSDKWGRHYRLFRVPTLTGTSNPRATHASSSNP